LVNHGVVVYLTQNERQKLSILNYAGNGMGLMLVLVSIAKQFLRPES